ncbi:zinc-binding dehydrogenase [Sulfodiicoccus acidiphilus]|nr:alcohol dehydrogenase catalytic domain-containing protein [Sulfodiicoccus acidiphilus]
MEIQTQVAILREFGRDFTIEKAKLNVKEGDTIVRVKASGICGRDLVIWKGGFKNLRPPLILGHENYGEVEGEPVGVMGNVSCGTCHYCETGMSNLCEKAVLLGEGRPGGYADDVPIPTPNVFQLPDREYGKYAGAVCPVATAIHAGKLAGVKTGDRVLVTGAGGGVGIHAIQVLKRMGAKVIAQTGENKSEFVKRWADEVVTDSEFSKAVDSVDSVIELVGAPTINESMRTVRRRGTIVVVGNVTGEPLNIVRPALLVMREITLLGSASYTPTEVLEAVKMVHEEDVKAVFKEYPLEEVNKAYKELQERKVVGRAVLIH